MDDITLQSAVYKSSKHMQLQDVYTAKATGFHVAADDYMSRNIDLNDQLISNRLATYFFRMNSEAMKDAGINCGDVLIVDRSVPAASGKIIVASFNGELVVRRLYQTIKGTMLIPENANHSSFTIVDGSKYAVWGVVTYVIHTVS